MPKTVKSCNSSQCNETFLVLSVRPGKSSVFSLLRKTCNDGDDRTDSGKLFQSDAAVTGKVQSPMVEHTVRGATSADVVEERSCHHALRCDTR